MNRFAEMHAAPDAEVEGWQGRKFTDGDFSLNYRIKLPADINDGKIHPLVLSMHGAGSIGNDNLKQLYLATLFADNNAAVAAASPIIVAPQCPEGQYWVPIAPDWQAKEIPLQREPARALAAVMDLMEKLLGELPVDFTRVYVIGCSMGGFAAWELLFRREWFAAAVIVCGAGDPEKLGGITSVALKLFHGTLDTVVPVSNSRMMCERFQKIRGNVEYTEYPDVYHDSWGKAFADPETARWLFAQKRRTVLECRTGIRETVRLSAHGFTAEIVPEIGGNLFRLRDPNGRALLREPHSLDELSSACVCFGIPTLFPPNRIDGGKFTFRGRECSLPVTEPRNNNALHGLAANQPWQVVHQDAESAVLRYAFTAADPRHAGFPFTFTMTHAYRLLPDGLEDVMTVRNDGQEIMPLGLGYHTAFPADGVKLRMGTAEYEIAPNGRNLPTGENRPWRENDPRTLFDPAGHSFDLHTPARPLQRENGEPLHGAELHYPDGVLIYETDEKFGFWYTWNAGGYNRFVCIEPVSWMCNTLNLRLPPETTGLRELAPGAEVSFRNRLRWQPA